MTQYARVYLGRGSEHVAACMERHFVGMNYDIAVDLGDAPDEWAAFNAALRPTWLAAHPGKNNISAGLSLGSLWIVVKHLVPGDIVLCPDGSGIYQVGEIAGPYAYVPGGILPHQRPVRWRDTGIRRDVMSGALKAAAGTPQGAVDLANHSEELARLLGDSAVAFQGPDGAIEDVASFVMEKHLEDFLVANWTQTDLGRRYDIYEEDGQKVGQQYRADTGPMDILAISKDRRELLVVELKLGRASDVVVGQTLRYMGYVKAELAEPEQAVKGVIIALQDDERLRRAI
jgi:restriction system protein